MPRRKPASAKQRKAELQIKRAIKRGDLPPETRTNSHGSGSKKGQGGEPHRGKQHLNANADASRRLESSFVKFSSEFLEEAKHKASSLTLARPITMEKLLFPLGTERRGSSAAMDSSHAQELAIPRRPKWRYDMSKKEVESNETGVFKKWLEETDRGIQTWKAEPPVPDSMKESIETVQSQGADPDIQRHADVSDRMPYATPLFERNLEVWRQLWRVTEICQVLLILLDSRCPSLHYPPSLDAYLSSLRPPRKVIFVLTKIDISGPRRSALWKEFLCKTYPSIRVVTVESYLEKNSGEGQGKRIVREPHISAELRRELVQALKEAHNELCSPPPYIASDASKLAAWKPSVLPTINWDAVLNAKDSDISSDQQVRRQETRPEVHPGNEDDSFEDYLSIGLIGQPNVGKSSLLNALFGSHKVKASKTPGKTKHFQTLFWSKQVRLVDCPGLVFPDYADLEMQVLAGILPIAQIPAIPSSIYHALQYLPLEKILALQHPVEKEDVIEDKRTWRGGMRPGAKSDSSTRTWTAMDVLTAFSEQRGWITAKAGRPDVNRAGNSILRALAEGRIKWAFYPPDMDLSKLTDEDKGLGIWIEGEADDDITTEYASSESEDGSDFSSDSEENDSTIAEDEVEDKNLEFRSHSGLFIGTGMFGALALEDKAGSAESGSE